jgi:hypothetical protein
MPGRRAEEPACHAGHGDQRFESELTQPAIDWLEQLRKGTVTASGS